MEAPQERARLGREEFGMETPPTSYTSKLHRAHHTSKRHITSAPSSRRDNIYCHRSPIYGVSPSSSRECHPHLSDSRARSTHGSLHSPKDRVGPGGRAGNDGIRPRLCVGHGVSAQLGRIPRGPDVGNVAVGEVNPHAVKPVDADHAVKAIPGVEESFENAPDQVQMPFDIRFGGPGINAVVLDTDFSRRELRLPDPIVAGSEMPERS